MSDVTEIIKEVEAAGAQWLLRSDTASGYFAHVHSEPDIDTDGILHGFARSCPIFGPDLERVLIRAFEGWKQTAKDGTAP